MNKKIISFDIHAVRPFIEPASREIRIAIQQSQIERSIDIAVHYIVPSISHTDYYARLQGRLETELCKAKNLSWHYHPPKGDSPQHIYLEFVEVLEIMRPNDAVILVPKDLGNPQLLERFKEVLNKNPSGIIIFIDQQPPSEAFRPGRTYFVGPDNRKVGILAAFVLRYSLKNMK